MLLCLIIQTEIKENKLSFKQIYIKKEKKIKVCNNFNLFHINIKYKNNNDKTINLNVQVINMTLNLRFVELKKL